MLWPGYSITRVALPRRLNFIAQLGDLLDGCNARGVLWSGHAFTHAARVACASDRVGSGRGGTEVVVHVRIEPGLGGGAGPSRMFGILAALRLHRRWSAGVRGGLDAAQHFAEKLGTYPPPLA
eukprot:gene25588-biopygen10522